nr:alpha-protein kinase 3-like [Nerophis lumbriciformis]
MEDQAMGMGFLGIVGLEAAATSPTSGQRTGTEGWSTLCSMIAQLTQETQPAFMTTLKSKAVSESSNVKFFCVVTGYPIPQLTWYKDDKQLDRLCGLPKYEIFRNGQNHSLHIYNCTVEDAAIYQASASNSKGIVSCSGVLEVGGMNEFKIHQRYFAKLKQRTEGRSGKENQKPLRSISPERTQRKRRSTVEVFSSVPSSKEDEVPKEFIQSVGEDSKVRVEEPIEEPMEETLAPLAKSETDNEIGIAKTAFVKKKIKIFPRGERTPEETKESENVKKIGPFGKLLRKKSSEALRSPESAKKNKESDQKCDEKVLEKNPVIPSRLISTPEHQQDSEPVIQHLTDPRPVDRILQKKSALPEQPSDQLPQKETKARQRNSSMQKLASGARRKIPSSMDKSGEAKLPPDTQPEKQEVSQPDNCTRQSPLLPHPNDEISSPVEKRSPTLGRKKTSAVTLSQPLNKDIKSETSEDRLDPCKAPQVIRKIRSERFADTSGHLKLWCQFFNILTDSTIAWYRNDVEIARITRSATDESQVNLAVIQASSKDSGVYKCAITNDYGSDSTEFLLGSDILGRISQREDHGVGEEIEMAPLVFNKGVADSGVWGNKLFGRVMVDKSCIDEGSTHKVWRAKVIYGLEPVFESGHTCIIKVNREIAYGGKEEHGLTERNLDLVKQHCKIQNLAREYCKIFSAEARVIENFGPPLEVIPVHLMYRPANTIPYATVEADLAGVYQKYVAMDHMGKIETKATSDIGLKCCALQHWIFQWTSGNLLITRLEGVDTKVTNIGITVRSTGHQGFQIEGRPEVFEGFVSQHHCNYFCGLLGLRSLKILDSLTTPAKSKGSRSPLLQRKNQASGSCSPQTGRRAAGSPRTPRKSQQDVTNTLKVAVEVSP